MNNLPGPSRFAFIPRPVCPRPFASPGRLARAMCPDARETRIMTTLYIRDGENYREAEGREVLDKAQAAIRN